ncbi:erythromycin esterase family protein [Pigmentiphaga aceris]|uniref:erythromycin esterase family protein n=1 Tax=Pigmentiphaga aceris TaxID=1940612 RepID=UPI0016525BE9|nr:erythromycin esterase family protein [Pigmentiphaga aceris]
MPSNTRPALNTIAGPLGLKLANECRKGWGQLIWRQRRTSLAFLLATSLLVGMSGLSQAQALSHPSPSTPTHALTTLAASHSTQEWAFVDTLVAGKKLVLLGESGHGVQQSLEARNRLFEYLVQTHGFTTIALETGFEDGMEVNEYVNGARSLDDTLVAKVFSFSAPRSWDANRQLIEWMRQHNARVGPAKAVRFYGIEMLGNARYLNGADRSPARRSADAALAYLHQVDPGAGKAWQQRMEPLLAALVQQRYADISSVDRESMTLALADLVKLFERQKNAWTGLSSFQRFQRAYRNALNARNLDTDLRSNGWWAGADPGNRQRNLDMRDASMADNVKWVLDQEGARGRVLVFSAFKHAVRVPRTSHRASDRGFIPMGQQLHTTFKHNMAIIGMIAAREAREFYTDDGLAAFINAGSADVFAVNFRELAGKPDASNWWQTSCTFGDCQQALTSAADAVIFVKTPQAALSATTGRGN